MANITETTDAAASFATAYTLGVGQTAQGQLSTLGDHDWYRIDLVAGQSYAFSVVGLGHNNNDLDDAFLYLRGSSGALITSNDDGGPGSNSTTTYTATASGTYYLDVGAYNNGSAGQYGLVATAGSRPSYDVDMGAGVLLGPSVSWSTPGTGANVTYAFRQTDSGDETNFSQLTATEKSAVQSILAMYAQVCGLTFTPVNPGGYSNSATMLFSNYAASDGAGAYAYYPGSTASSSRAGDVYLNTNSVSTTSLPMGGYSYFAIMHEVGHAVGLAHPGDYNAGVGVSITYDSNAQFVQDTHQYTVMSYFDESFTGASSFSSHADTLMLFDIYALQRLYGANTTTRTGNTTYGFNSNAGAVYDFAQNTTPALCIWDAGGTDTLDASGFTQNQTISLEAGTFSSIGSRTGNVSIAFGATIENAIGGTGIDTVTGNSADNTLNGGLGVDILRGGAGNDAYIIDSSFEQIFENAGEGTADAIYTTVDFQLSANLENAFMQGTANLAVYGNDLVNVIIGNDGDNLLNGGAGIDGLLGGKGGDTYVIGDSREDILELAGEGTDAVYASVSYALGANLETLFLSGSAIQGIGNAQVNSIVGTAGDNGIDGGGGADVMTGNGGIDTFVFRQGQMNGDVIQDFDGLGAGAGDQIQFIGFGAGATLQQITPMVWQVTYDAGASSELFTLGNSYTLHASDYGFL